MPGMTNSNVVLFGGEFHIRQVSVTYIHFFFFLVLQFNPKCNFVSKSGYRHYISPHLKNFPQLKKIYWGIVDLL